jgi:hypothetical protein
LAKDNGLFQPIFITLPVSPNALHYQALRGSARAGPLEHGDHLPQVLVAAGRQLCGTNVAALWVCRVRPPGRLGFGTLGGL